jgi:hypothetical protein
MKSVMFAALIAALLPALAQASLCTLSWNADADPVDGYAVYVTSTPGQYQQGPAWIGNGLTVICDDLGLTADGVTYYFIVKAFIGSDFSGPSNEVFFTMPAPVVTPPPPPKVCLKYNGKGRCIKWG